jgi:adenylate cyclase
VEGKDLVETSARLIFHGPAEERQVLLNSGYAWKIGRSEQNHVVISDHRASRQHALIQRTESGDYYLIDLGSRNGSFINDQRVSMPAHLRDGDCISIGGYPIMFRYEGYGNPTVIGTSEENERTQAWFVPQLLTVLVVDVRNFTGLTQKIDQALLCEAIGTWFRHASEIMHKHGSWTMKYIGDAVMAIWLHREEGKEARDILRTLRAVAEFAEATSALESRFALPFPLRIGAGINTGIASIGNTGTNSVLDYTALGDPVNNAFRIEAATKEIGLEVALGTATFESLREKGVPVDCFEERSVLLKGYDAPQRLWAVSFASLQRFVEEAAG